MIIELGENPPILLDFKKDAPNYGDEIPIRFRVADIDLLISIAPDKSPTPWLPLLILPFTTYGMACIRITKKFGRAALNLDEYANELLFKMVDEEYIYICDTWGEITVRVKYTTLFDAWKIFAEDAYQKVVQHRPEMRTHPRWDMIYHDPPPNLIEELTRASWFDERECCF